MSSAYSPSTSSRPFSCSLSSSLAFLHTRILQSRSFVCGIGSDSQIRLKYLPPPLPPSSPTPWVAGSGPHSGAVATYTMAIELRSCQSRIGVWKLNHLPLLWRDRDEESHELQKSLYQPGDPGFIVCECPDSCVDITWVEALNGNFLVLIVLKDTVLKLCEPNLGINVSENLQLLTDSSYLEVQLVVLIISQRSITGIRRTTIPAVEIKFAFVVIT
jgi:hypothetical protein